MTRLGDAVSRDVRDRGPRVLLVPLGSCEQHGPHLPLDTDARIAVAIAVRAATELDAWAAPALPYGASGEHAGFAGTLSIGHEALEHVITELVRSASGFSAVVLVNGHGGNADGVARALATADREGRRCLAWWPTVDGGDAHAGRTETSLMLAIAPDTVRLDRAEAGDSRAIADLMPVLRAQGVASVSSNGVLGDPAGASAPEGAALLESLTAELVEAVRSWLGPADDA